MKKRLATSLGQASSGTYFFYDISRATRAGRQTGRLQIAAAFSACCMRVCLQHLQHTVRRDWSINTYIIFLFYFVLITTYNFTHPAGRPRQAGFGYIKSRSASASVDLVVLELTKRRWIPEWQPPCLFVLSAYICTPSSYVGDKRQEPPPEVSSWHRR